jgi:hypothetical protein
VDADIQVKNQNDKLVMELKAILMIKTGPAHGA